MHWRPSTEEEEEEEEEEKEKEEEEEEGEEDSSLIFPFSSPSLSASSPLSSISEERGGKRRTFAMR